MARRYHRHQVTSRGSSYSHKIAVTHKSQFGKDKHTSELAQYKADMKEYYGFRKKLKSAGGYVRKRGKKLTITAVGILSVVALFSMIPGVVFEWDDDVRCPGLCVSYLNVTSIKYDLKFGPDVQPLSFSPNIKDFEIRKLEKGKWVPFVIAGKTLRRGEKNKWQLEIRGYKEPTQTVKWSFAAGEDILDPAWLGAIEGDKVIYEDIRSKLTVWPHTSRTIGTQTQYAEIDWKAAPQDLKIAFVGDSKLQVKASIWKNVTYKKQVYIIGNKTLPPEVGGGIVENVVVDQKFVDAWKYDWTPIDLEFLKLEKGKYWYTYTEPIKTKDPIKFKYSYNTPITETGGAFKTSGKWEFCYEYGKDNWYCNDPWYDASLKCRVNVTASVARSANYEHYIEVPMNLTQLATQCGIAFQDGVTNETLTLVNVTDDSSIPVAYIDEYQTLYFTDVFPAIATNYTYQLYFDDNATGLVPRTSDTWGVVLNMTGLQPDYVTNITYTRTGLDAGWLKWDGNATTRIEEQAYATNVYAQSSDSNHFLFSFFAWDDSRYRQIRPVNSTLFYNTPVVAIGNSSHALLASDPNEVYSWFVNDPPDAYSTWHIVPLGTGGPGGHGVVVFSNATGVNGATARSVWGSAKTDKFGEHFWWGPDSTATNKMRYYDGSTYTTLNYRTAATYDVNDGWNAQYDDTGDANYYLLGHDYQTGGDSAYYQFGTRSDHQNYWMSQAQPATPNSPEDLAAGEQYYLYQARVTWDGASAWTTATVDDLMNSMNDNGTTWVGTAESANVTLTTTFLNYTATPASPSLIGTNVTLACGYYEPSAEGKIAFLNQTGNATVASSTEPLYISVNLPQNANVTNATIALTNSSSNFANTTYQFALDPDDATSSIQWWGGCMDDTYHMVGFKGFIPSDTVRRRIQRYWKANDTYADYILDRTNAEKWNSCYSNQTHLWTTYVDDTVTCEARLYAYDSLTDYNNYNLSISVNCGYPWGIYANDTHIFVADRGTSSYAIYYYDIATGTNQGIFLQDDIDNPLTAFRDIWLVDNFWYVLQSKSRRVTQYSNDTLLRTATFWPPDVYPLKNGIWGDETYLWVSDDGTASANRTVSRFWVNQTWDTTIDVGDNGADLTDSGPLASMSKNFASEINAYLSTCTAVSGNCTVPIKISGASSGQVEIANYVVTYNQSDTPVTGATVNVELDSANYTATQYGDYYEYYNNTMSVGTHNWTCHAEKTNYETQSSPLQTYEIQGDISVSNVWPFNPSPMHNFTELVDFNCSWVATSDSFISGFSNVTWLRNDNYSYPVGPMPFNATWLPCNNATTCYTNVSVTSNYTSVGDNWTCAVTAWNGTVISSANYTRTVNRHAPRRGR